MENSEENAGGTVQSLPAFSVMADGLAAGAAATGLRAATETALATGLQEEPDLDEEPDFEDEPDLEVFDLL